MKTTRIFGASNDVLLVKLKGIVFEETFIISIDDEDAIEMIDFVLNGDSEESVCDERLLLPSFILIGDGYGLIPLDGEELPGEGETSFLEEDALLFLGVRVKILTEKQDNATIQS